MKMRTLYFVLCAVITATVSAYAVDPNPNATPISIQQMFQNSPKESSPQGATRVITVRGGVLRQMSYSSVHLNPANFATAAQGAKADTALQPSGNAATATKLQTPRTINGVSFDGSANITVSDTTREPVIPTGTTAQYIRGDKSLATFPALPTDVSCGVGKHVSAYNAATGAYTCTDDATSGGATDTNAVHVNGSGEINALTAKTTPASSDVIMVEDSAATYAKKKWSWSSIVSAITSALSSTYHGMTVTWAEITGKPTLAASATTDTTNAANVSSGTLNAARLPSVPFGNMSGALKANTITAPQFTSNAADGTHMVFCANTGDMTTAGWTTADAGKFCYNQATGKYRYWNGSALADWTGGSGGGTVTSITASAPLTGGIITGSGTIGLPQATGSASGYLSSTDWATFNGKQAAIGFTPLNPANNLSELPNKATALNNLGAAAAVGAQDIEITDATKGLLLKSTGGNRYRLVVADNGTLSTSLVNATVFSPNAPTGISATGGSNQTTVNWSSSVVDSTHSTATSYDVLWGTTSGGETNTLAGVNSPYAHTGLSASTTYFYKVRANNSMGSATSTETSATTSAITYAPNAPTAVTATAGNAQNTVTWTAGTVDGTHSAATSYNLLWGTSSGGETNTLIGVTSPYAHTALTNGTAYYYKVRALNSVGSADSGEYSAMPAAAPNDPVLATYTNNDSSHNVWDSTLPRTYTSMKFTPVANTSQLYRNITLPSTGTVTFTRWFRVSSGMSTTAYSTIWGLAPNSSVPSWYANVAYNSGGAGLYYVDGWHASSLLYASITANTWYRVTATINLSTTYTKGTFTLYDASGTQLAQAANVQLFDASGDMRGLALTSIVGRAGSSDVFWVTDSNDGGL